MLAEPHQHSCRTEVARSPFPHCCAGLPSWRTLPATLPHPTCGMPLQTDALYMLPHWRATQVEGCTCGADAFGGGA